MARAARAALPVVTLLRPLRTLRRYGAPYPPGLRGGLRPTLICPPTSTRRRCRVLRQRDDLIYHGQGQCAGPGRHADQAAVPKIDAGTSYSHCVGEWASRSRASYPRGASDQAEAAHAGDGNTTTSNAQSVVPLHDPVSLIDAAVKRDTLHCRKETHLDAARKRARRGTSSLSRTHLDMIGTAQLEVFTFCESNVLLVFLGDLLSVYMTGCIINLFCICTQKRLHVRCMCC